MQKSSHGIAITSTQLLRLIAAANNALGIDLSVFRDDYLSAQFCKFMYEHRMSPIELLIRIEASASAREPGKPVDNRSVLLNSALLDCLYCGGDRFYRDRKVFEKIKDVIAALPPVFGVKNVSILSAGCGHGEEPSSIGLVAWNALNKSESTFTLFGIDISGARIKDCCSGSFHLSLLRDIPVDYLGGISVDDKKKRFKLIPEIGSAMHYKRANLFDETLATEYPSAFHLISMRYVLVFLKPQSKARLLESTLRMLACNGILWLGVGEFIENPSRYGLELLDASFYRKIEGTSVIESPC